MKFNSDFRFPFLKMRCQRLSTFQLFKAVGVLLAN